MVDVHCIVNIVHYIVYIIHYIVHYIVFIVNIATFTHNIVIIIIPTHTGPALLRRQRVKLRENARLSPL